MLNTNKLGFFAFCDDCKEYHLQLNNLFFSFTEEQLNKFLIYLEDIDLNPLGVAKYKLNRGRNLVLPVLHPNMVVLINKEELFLLKRLIMGNGVKNYNISCNDIPFNFNYN